MKTAGIFLQSLVMAALLCANTHMALAAQAQAPETAAASAAVAKANNAFACDLYGKLRQKKGNLFFSPISVSAALAMTYAGAKGDTATQMNAVLHFPFSREKLHPAYGAFLEHLGAIQENGNVQLGIANSLWPKEGFRLLENYTDLLRGTYGVDVTPVDYSQSEAARKTINGWVEEKTRGKITNLIPPGVFTPDTRLTLVNAVYFKGDWQLKFDKAQTQDGPFFTGAGKTVQTPLMRQVNHFKHGQQDGLQLLELPYAGGELSMLILLPEEKTQAALNSLESALSAERIALWQGQMSMSEVDLLLPKFRITWGAESLKNPLQALGLTNAFTSTADFSGMTGNRDLFIQEILHKAFVDVHEEGTEAAAATGAVMAVLSEEPPPVRFHADHPFLFLIQDTATGAILFMGRMSEPAGSK